MAFEQKLDLVSPRPPRDIINAPGAGGMIRDKGLVGVAQAGMNELTQRGNQVGGAIGNVVNQGLAAGGKLLYGQGYTPEGAAAITGGIATPKQVAVPPVRQVSPTVDLGGGSSITAQRPIQPDMAQRIQAAAVPSTQDQLDRRAAEVAMVQQRRDASEAWDAANAPQAQAPQVGGMIRPVGPDYSGVIDQAIGDMQSRRPSGSFDRQLEYKNKVENAKNILNLVGGMQTAGNQNANQLAISGMGNQSAQQIAAGNQAAQTDIARQRNAIDLGELASQDQYRTAQAGTNASEFGMKKQAAETEAARLAAASNMYADQLKAQGTGMFFNDQDLLDRAELVRSRAVSPADMFKQLNK